MDDIQQRLISCFSAVFPNLDENSIREATMTSVEEWDSVATVTLMTVVEEEFGATIDVDDVDRMASFDSLLAYVRETSHNGHTAR